MIIQKDKPTIYTVPENDSIYVYSSKTADMVKLNVPQPKENPTLLDKLRSRFSTYPELTVVPREDIAEVLADQNANIVELKENDVASLAFENSKGELINPASVYSVKGEGLWSSGISANKLNEYVEELGVTPLGKVQNMPIEGAVETSVSAEAPVQE